MKPTILIRQSINAEISNALRKDFALRYEKDGTSDVTPPPPRALITDGHLGCTRQMMEKTPTLEMIACFGIGTDAIDLKAAQEHQIRVSNTPDVLTDAVAELALGLMIALARQIPQADHFVRTQAWHQGAYPLTQELSGTTAGIFGLGRIGKEIARRATACKINIVYHGRRKDPQSPYPFYPSLIDMAHKVQWLIITAPATQQTYQAVNREVLEALGEKGALVNVARGAIVDEKVLVELLKNKKLGGAALDVFAQEPHTPPGLDSLSNVILSPHQASATVKTRKAMGDLLIRNLQAHFAGAPLITPVV